MEITRTTVVTDIAPGDCVWLESSYRRECDLSKEQQVKRVRLAGKRLKCKKVDKADLV